MAKDKKLQQNKQNINNEQVNNQKKKHRQLAFFSICIILLVFSLLLALVLNNELDVNKNGIMDKFYQYYNNEDTKTIYCYDSSNAENDEYDYELGYLRQLSKDYELDYLPIDFKHISNKNQNKIKSMLGIKGDKPTTVVVKNQRIISVQCGYVESHRLVEFLIKATVLKENTTYKAVDNLKFIDYDEYRSILKEHDTNLVVIGQAGCQYCIAAKTILNNISKGYKLTINYLDVLELAKDDFQDFFAKLPDLGYNNTSLTEEDIFPMPTLLIIKDGKIISYLENSVSLEEYVSYLSENNIIN